MKEFLEKLIGRLEEQRGHICNCMPCNGCKYIGDCNEGEFAEDVALDKAISIVNQLAEEYQSRIMIDGQYCWQTCACTEKCNECNRLTLESSDIDWYENIEDWTEEYRPRTNADRIRNMNDEELAELFVEKCKVGKEFAMCWLQSEVKEGE